MVMEGFLAQDYESDNVKLIFLCLCSSLRPPTSGIFHFIKFSTLDIEFLAF